MNILVTGGNGYIGCHCVIALMDAGYDVITFDNFYTGHFYMSDVFKNIKSRGKFIGTVNGDLTKISDIAFVFENNKIESVIHFAALSQVAESMNFPSRYYRNNVYGTLNLLDSMVSNHVDKIVF
jgi:UDP-glucose 4-epimerase